MTQKRIKQLREYYNATYFKGSTLPFMLENSNHESVFCDKCGNIANGVVSIKRSKGEFNIPLCKYHFLEIFPETNGFPTLKEYDFLKLKQLKFKTIKKV